jgi:hypothetical protein
MSREGGEGNDANGNTIPRSAIISMPQKAQDAQKQQLEPRAQPANGSRDM